MAVHWHYMNGTSGCYPDSSEIYDRKRDAIEFAEQLFGDTLRDKCFRNMSKQLRKRGFYAHHYFDTRCEEEGASGGQCSSGADYVEIRQAHSKLFRGQELECNC